MYNTFLTYVNLQQVTISKEKLPSVPVLSTCDMLLATLHTYMDTAFLILVTKKITWHSLINVIVI